MFAGTGLPLDHVNAHKHFHLHPTMLGMMLDIGKRYGLSAVRLPREPSFPGGASLGYRVGIAPWLRHLERRLNRAGMAHNDHLVGLTATGQMNEAELLRTITALPTGISEIYLYPVTRNHT